MSVRHAFEVLAVLAEDEELRAEGMGVVKVADRLGIDKSQASRILKLLAEEGMVDRHPHTRAYRLGWRMVAMSEVVARRDLVRSGRSVTHAVAQATGGAAAVCVLSRGESVVLLSSGVDPTGLLRTGRQDPACTSVGGRVLLAGLPDTDLAGRHPGDCHRHASPDGLRALGDQLARVRASGHETVTGPVGGPVGGLVAVPVRDRLDQTVAALVVTTGRHRDPAALRHVVDRATTASRSFAAHLAVQGSGRIRSIERSGDVA